jgi:uncharacterized protein (TIGR00251 family)
MGACWRMEGDALILNVKVHPRAGRAALGRIAGGELQVHVKGAPERGKAMDELLNLMIDIFGVRPGSVTLVTGAFRPHKIVRIQSPVRWPAVLSAAKSRVLGEKTG